MLQKKALIIALREPLLQNLLLISYQYCFLVYPRFSFPLAYTITVIHRAFFLTIPLLLISNHITKSLWFLITHCSLNQATCEYLVQFHSVLFSHCTVRSSVFSAVYRSIFLWPCVWFVQFEVVLFWKNLLCEKFVSMAYSSGPVMYNSPVVFNSDTLSSRQLCTLNSYINNKRIAGCKFFFCNKVTLVYVLPSVKVTLVYRLPSLIDYPR